jgi:hypothetical protein
MSEDENQVPPKLNLDAPDAELQSRFGRWRRGAPSTRSCVDEHLSLSPVQRALKANRKSRKSEVAVANLDGATLININPAPEPAP